ncbi:MAG: hypothetical protein IPM54_25125 [Polyangiaceae bacterium]|nr:hypothetical protein [Polyangiaceae bacterium]
MKIDIDGWTLGKVSGEDEPRVEDVELARRLGIGRERKIRDLIARHVSAGNLNDYEVLTTVVQTSEKGGRPGRAYWLTEAAALFIVTKSETQNAIALTKEMIQVFMLARRGILSHSASLMPAVREVVREELAAVFANMKPRKTKPRPPEQEDFLQAPLHAPLLIPLEKLAWEINPHEGTIAVRQLLAEISSQRRAGCPMRIAIAQHIDEFVAHKGAQSIDIRVGRYLRTLINLPPHDGRVVFKEAGMTTRWGVRRVSRSIVAA